MHVAKSVVALYNQAPSLAQTAARMEGHAHEQTAAVRKVVRETDEISKNLEAVIQQLERSAEAALASLSAMKQITSMAKIVAINAAIEASRAGNAGRPFAVVATEMQKLAAQTEQTSVNVSQQLQHMRAKVEDVVRVVGKKDAVNASGAGQAKQVASVAVLNQTFHAIDTIADQQENEAQQVRGMSERTRTLSEELLLEVGRLRFGIHAQCEKIVAALTGNPALASGKAEEIDAVLIDALRTHSFLDLLYLTNEAGIQITRNLGHDYATPGAGEAARGKDWSQRPWFRSAMAQPGPVTSDLYLSVANNQFCFTVSEAIRDAHGRVLGVLGADVVFERLLQAR